MESGLSSSELFDNLYLPTTPLCAHKEHGTWVIMAKSVTKKNIERLFGCIPKHNKSFNTQEIQSNLDLVIAFSLWPVQI